MSIRDGQACELSASAPTQAVGVVLQDTDRELPEHTDDTLLAGSFLIELFDID